MTRTMHPLCGWYRDLRSRARFVELSIPWMWYRRTEIRVRGLALRSSTNDDDDARTSYPRWTTMGWIAIRGGGYDDDDIIAAPPPPPRKSTESSSSRPPSPSSPLLLPPSIVIETMDVSIRSAWSRPVVSARLRGITINVVVRRGEFPPLPLVNHHHHHGGDGVGVGVDGRGGGGGGTAPIMIGDMTLREALDALPSPPEEEGTYPRIGIVNVSDATLCLYERDDGVVHGRPPALKLLLKIGVPDEFFVPVTEMTLGEIVPFCGLALNVCVSVFFCLS